MGKRFLILILSVMILYIFFGPQKFNETHSNLINQSYSFEFPLGTDSLGRDVLLKNIYAFFFSLLISSTVILGSLFLGVMIGYLLTIKMRYLNWFLELTIEIFDVIPMFILVSVLSLFFQNWISSDSIFINTFFGLIISMTLVSWVGIAKWVSNEINLIKKKEFIIASKLMGASRFHLLRYHYLSHLKKLTLISVIQSIPSLILLESFVSFIGFGVTPPYNTIGTLINSGWKYAFIKPEMFIIPCLFLILLIAAVKSVQKIFKRA